jgi:hypothetical protein
VLETFEIVQKILHRIQNVHLFSVRLNVKRLPSVQFRAIVPRSFFAFTDLVCGRLLGRLLAYPKASI